MSRRIKIESMAFKGTGVGRIDGKATFVPFTLQGDEVVVEITTDKKTYCLGQLKEILISSPHRVMPLCPSFGTCGGCQWQHIDASLQGEMKRDILWDILKRLGKFRPIPSIDVIPFANPYGYRIRVQLKVKGKAIGYYQQGSHRIVDISHCPISHPLVNRMISILREQQDDFPSLKEIEINVSPHEEKAVLLLHSPSHDLRLKEAAKKLLQSYPLLKGIAISEKKRWTLLGNPSLFFTIPLEGKKKDLSLRISAGSFFQINLEQNQKLIQTVMAYTGPTKNDRVLDLYAGAGNFTLPLALYAGEVWGVEENETAIEDARFNSERNGIRNVHFIKGKVEEVLKNWKREKPDQVVLDPPRAGCKTSVQFIVGLRPQKMIYVSCDPATFARDLRLFSEGGYSVKHLCLIDMFPQTYHMEVVGLLLPS